MALPITIPYTFANATSSIPLSNLDSDFTTVVNTINGIGNGTVALSNVSITGGVISGITINSANVSFQSTLANSVVRTGLAKYSDIVSVKDFGAVGDGSTDDTTAIQYAITDVANAGGGTVYFPYGTYKITSALTFTGGKVKLLGTGKQSSIIKQFTTNSKILNILTNNNSAVSLGFTYNGTPAAGASAIYCSGFYNYFDDLDVNNAYDAFEGDGSSVQSNSIYVDNCEIRNYARCGFYLHDQCFNWLVSNVFCVNDTNSYGSLGAIRLYNQSEGHSFTNVQVYQGAYCITTDATSNVTGSIPAYNKFSNSYFDSCTNGCSINYSIEFDFNNCWFSNRPSSGISIATANGIRFTGGGAVNNQQNGVSVGANATKVSFVNFSARGNNTGGGSYYGILIQSNCSYCTIIGCSFGDTLSYGTQAAGLYIASGSSDYYVVGGNQFSGTGGSYSDNASGANRRVFGNPGVTDYPATTAAAAGSNTQIQYNNSGALAGSANLTYNGTVLTNVGSVISSNYYFGSSSSSAGTIGASSGNSGAYTIYYGSTSANPDVTLFANSTGEKMRLSSSGNLSLNTTNTGQRFNIGWIPSGETAIVMKPNSETYNGQAILFLNSSGGTSGYINQQTSTVSYVTSSDYRMKENVAPLSGGLTTIGALKPVTYNWKIDGTAGEGFIAHELQTVVPHAVTGEKDAVNEDGSIKPQGVDYSKIVVHLVAAIQELSAKNDALEARLAALEVK